MIHDLQHRTDDRSLGDLFSDLTREMKTLVRQEVDLAKTEMSGKLSRMGKNAGMIAAGGAIVYGGVLTIIAGIVFLIGLAIPLWASALIVGALVTLGGAYLAKTGLDALKEVDLVPRETIETLKEEQGAVNTLRRAA